MKLPTTRTHASQPAHRIFQIIDAGRERKKMDSGNPRTNSDLKATLAAIALCATCTLAIAQPVFEEDGPFRIAEGFGTPATCETVADWIERVPDYDGRITMVVKGTIEESHWDGALAYLLMCKPGGVQVMCVTYTEQKASPQLILFAGGYSRVGERQIMLDPCLVYPVE